MTDTLGGSSLPDGRSTSRLVRLLQTDRDPYVRVDAAYKLGNIGGPRAAAALREALANRGETPAVRGMAAEQLGGSFSWEAIPDLIAGLRDASPQVRFWCAYAVGFLRTKDALPDLEHLAATDRTKVPGWWTIAREARWAIKEIQLGPWET